MPHQMPPEGEAKSTWVNLTTFKAPVVDGTAGVDGFDGGDTGVSDDDEEGLVDTEKEGKFVYYRLASDDVVRIMRTLWDIYCAPK